MAKGDNTYTAKIDPRVRRVEISPEYVLTECYRNLRAGVEVFENPVPEDATIAWCYYDASRGNFVLVMEHPDFDEVPEGTLIPELLTVFKRDIPDD